MPPTLPVVRAVIQEILTAHFIVTTPGYIERLLTYLEKLDSPHEFSVLVRKKDRDYWKPSKSNFKVVVADYHQYTFAEQVGFYFFLRNLNPDLVHFCLPPHR